MILSEMCMYNQPNHFETQVTVIPILKMENKNRERQAPSLDDSKFQALSSV